MSDDSYSPDETEWNWVGDEQRSHLSRRSALKAAGVAGASSLLPLGGAAVAAANQGNGTGSKTSSGQTSVTFSEPVRINEPQRYGYEPSVHVDQFGTIYATAHKSSITNEGTQLSSFFWYSIDGGETWKDMPSPANVDDKLYAFEGDIAIDDAGMVYYCDTDLADNTFSRWKTAPGGPIYDLSKVMGTTAVDDRPWLRAHGDGIVYYLGNNGVSIPDSDGDVGRIFFYRSTDGGLTFTEGDAIPTSYYCSLAESKADDHTVYVASPANSNGGTVFDVFTSHDRGKSWTRETVGTYDHSPSDPFPAWSVTDFAGNPYHVWIDDDTAEGEQPGVIKFTRRDGTGDWETLGLTPFDGTFTKQWIGAGRDGFVAIVFYATQDVPVGSSSDWFPYALVTTDAQASNPQWSLSRLAEYPVATDGSEPEDFFEVAVGPFDRIHVTFGREIRPGTIANPTRTYRNNIFYTQGTVDT